MNILKRFKISFISLGLWLLCLGIYILTLPGDEYSLTTDGAKKLGGFMNQCSGGVINYENLGYRCDAYGPTGAANVLILIGIVSFIIAIVTFIVRLVSKNDA